MRDIRGGICPLCAHTEIVETIPAHFGDGNFELTDGVAVTYEPRWVMRGRNPSHPRGLIRVWFCRGCGFMQSFVEDPAAVPIDEGHRTALHRRAGAGGADNPNRRLVRTVSASLYVGDGGIDQDWPNGALHTIRWARPLSMTFSRSPLATGPVADVHVQLKQSAEARLEIVAFTLCLTDSPAIQQLPPLVTFLPRVEGQDAGLLCEVLRQVAALHDLPFPI